MTGEAETSDIGAPQTMCAPTAESQNRDAWKVAAIAAGVLCACLIVAHWQTVVGLVQLWNTDAYGHGPFVFAASAYLVWRQRKVLFNAPPRPAISGPFVLLLISAAWLLVHVMVMKAGRELLFVASFSAIVLSVSGWRALRILAFPLAYLFLAVSAWDVLLGPLQTATAVLSTDLLQLFGLPVFRETHYIDVPMGQFLVEKACAGLRTFLAGMAVGALYAYISYRDLWRRAVFLCLTTIWALAINVIRVAITVGSAFPLGMHNFVQLHHGTLGWILFGVGLIPLFAAGRWLSQDTPHYPDTTKFRSNTSHRGLEKTRVIAITLAAAIVIGLAPASADWYTRQSSTAYIHLPTLINVPGSWHVDAGRLPDWKPIFHGNDGELHLVYRNASGETVWLYSAFYTSERPGSKLIFYANRLYDSLNWQAVQSKTLDVDVAGGRLPVREIVLSNRNGTRNRIIWYWYRVAGANTTSQIGAKLLRVRSLFSHAGTAVIAVASDVTADPAATRKALGDILRGTYTILTMALDGGGSTMSMTSTKP